jgi:integrase-like protein
MATTSQWLFPGKLPGTRLAKLNGRHSDILDGLANCNCTHSRDQHVKGKCPCGCNEFIEASRFAFVIYDFRHTFATRAAESGMPVAMLAAILGHADLRSVTKYVHVRQEAQDREMERFETQSLSLPKTPSGFRPVEEAENREIEGWAGNGRKCLSVSKIN